MNKVGFIGGKFLPLHQGHVYAITRSACLCDELYVVLSYSVRRDEKLCAGSKLPCIGYQKRLRWLSQLTKDMENVKVISVEDFYDSDDSYNWEEGAACIKKAIGKNIDYVFSSENSYGDIFKKLYPGAEHIVIDGAKERYPVSATRIRKEGVFAHWDNIAEFVRRDFMKKVVIVGTESCGKSTMAGYLAKIYNTNFVPEYGRDLCDEIGGCEGILTYEDFYNIAYRHKILEKEALINANKIIFIDTEAIITQYYANLYLNKNFSVLDEIAGVQNYDLWLFLEPDVKWVNDGLRVHGADCLRNENNENLKKMLAERNIKFEIISGNYLERIDKAIKLVDPLII
jgi:HTH-type transcriptional repressor of NAD biosynthesis genes